MEGRFTVSRMGWPFFLIVAGFVGVLAVAGFEGVHFGPKNVVRNSHVEPWLHAKLRTGDLIFRRGTDLASNVVLAADNSSHFSHVGILVIQNGKPHVVHAVPAETEGASDSVVLESLEEFAKPERALSVSVYRVKGLVTQQVSEVDRLAREAVGKPFDSQFDLTTSDRLYCTELVWDIYRRIGVNLVQHFDKLTLPFFAQEVILPDSLIGPGLSKIY